MTCGGQAKPTKKKQSKMSGQSDKIEAMLIMAKDKTGRALEDVIERVLSQPEIFVFGEFIDLPNVQQVSCCFSLTLSILSVAGKSVKIFSNNLRFSRRFFF